MKEYERSVRRRSGVGGAGARVLRPGARRQRTADRARRAARAPSSPASAGRLSRRLSPRPRAGRPPAAARSAAADSGHRAARRSRSRSCAAAAPGSTTWSSRSRRAQLGERKVAHIAAVHPDVVATANPGCTLQIQSVAAEQGRPLKVMHPIELIDASIRGSRSQLRGGTAPKSLNRRSGGQEVSIGF